MKSLELHELSSFRVVERPPPQIAPDDVLLRIRACGICGSDVHGMDGSSGRRIPPVVMGHEAAGEIVEIGDDVRGFSAGDRVTFDSTLSCGECAFCLEGKVNLCESRKVFGVSCGDYKLDGAFTEYLAVPSRLLYHLPAGLDYSLAALAEPVGVALHAIKNLDPSIESEICVIGTGMIGLLILLALKHKGFQKVHAVDISPEKLDLAKDFGADCCHNSKQLASEDLREMDAALEVVGIEPTIKRAVGSVKKGGKVILVGNLSPEIAIPLQEVVTRELSLLGSCAIAGEYSEAIELIENNQTTLRKLISAIIPLEEAASWFSRLYAKEDGLFKVIVDPSL